MRADSARALGLAAGGHLPAGLAAALLPAAVLALGLDAFCLVSLVRAASVRTLPKPVWAIVILAVSAPFGALLYLFFGRDRSRAAPVAPALSRTARLLPAPAPATQARAGVDPIVTTSRLTKNYGGNGLFDVDLAVPLGSIYGLAGRNGAGKTTLLSILSGTRRPTSGSMHIGVDRRRIAVCPDVAAAATVCALAMAAARLTAREVERGPRAVCPVSGR